MPHTARPAGRHPLLDRVLASDGSLPFALLRRHGGTEVEVLTGDVVDADLLRDIPLDGAPVLAVVPYRQARERGFTVQDDGVPLRCLVVRESERLALSDAVAALPPEPVAAEPIGFDIPDDEYAGIVRRVIDDEIGQGAGANFVVMRSFEARTDAAPVPTLASWFRALLTHEVGSYWTFAIHAPAPGAAVGPAAEAVSLAGATPERHLTLHGGLARMNPISGTYRHPASGPTREGVLEFLGDTKENEELFMVVDEEMKMMSALCPDGGRIVGPYLKQMARLSHTEYLLEGRTTVDPRDALRLTMFAPTVTGSPMENACTVIARHETRPRGYYSGFLALFEPEVGPEAAGYSLDAPILIRTAYLHAGGRVSVPAGATLVRHSVPEHEVAETRAKAAGVLASLGLVPRGAGPDAVVDLNAQPGVAEALTARNHQLAEFWVRPQDAAGATGSTGATTTASGRAPFEPAATSPLAGRDVLVVDHEDQFTTMLAHQLGHLGMNARVVRWDAVTDVLADDLVVLGPGPGDPRDQEDPRIAALTHRILERVTAGRPLLAVCLSHQVLAGLAGFPLRALPAPRQGVRLEADVFGTTAAVGYYNTFGAHLTTVSAAAADNPVARLALEPSVDADGVLTALRGSGVASVQGHLESVLSADGITVLDALTRHALGVPGRTVSGVLAR